MNEEAALRQFFTATQPLGRITAEDHPSPESKTLFQTYFDRENYPFKALKRNPVMIVGRKGAGKTEVLLSYFYDNVTDNEPVGYFDPLIHFNHEDAANLFSLAVKQISDAVNTSHPPPMVESVAAFWDGLFWICIFTGIANSNVGVVTEEHKLISSYLDQFGISPELAEEPFKVLIVSTVSLLKKYRESMYAEDMDFFTALPVIDTGRFKLEEARFAALNWLRNNDKQAMVLFDSFEKLDLREVSNKLGISALLKAIGAFEKPGVPASFRCVIPAESYHYLTNMSSNTLKDFQRVHLIHWNAIELLRVSARRLAKYVELWAPEDQRREIASFDLEGRSGVMGFWRKFLPDKVRNRRNGELEEAIPYLLRHTQLLPRHTLFILNKVFADAIAANGHHGAIPKITSEMMTKSVRESENLIVEQIYDSYSHIWPSAKVILSAILPQMQRNCLEFSELQRIYNRSEAEKSPEIDRFQDFLRMMSELGAIGRVIREPGFYVTAVFEYSEPNRLIFTPGDLLCIHPVFSDLYEVHKEWSKDDYRPVYPLGTDPDDEDRRPEYVVHR